MIIMLQVLMDVTLKPIVLIAKATPLKLRAMIQKLYMMQLVLWDVTAVGRVSLESLYLVNIQLELKQGILVKLPQLLLRRVQE